MGAWSGNKASKSNINGGNEYSVDDGLQLESLNAMVNNSFYASEISENVAQQLASLGPTDRIEFKGSNPNLLINGDFRVNQRGQASYSASSSALYGVDRWRITTGGVFDVANKSLTTFASAYIGIMQYIENWEALKGKTVTASIKATSGAVGIRFGFKTANTDLAYVDGLVNTTGTLSVSFTIPSDANYTNFYVAIWNRGAETTTYDYVKLEIGSVATPFSPRPYAEELALCQRYYFKQQQANTIYNGFIFSTTVCRAYIYLPVTMRISPTLSYSNLSFARIYYSGNIKGISSIGAQSFSQIGINLNIVPAQDFDSSIVNSTIVFRFNVENVEFDAEIY